MFLFERANRICQSHFASQDLLRQLLQDTETLLEPPTTDDQFADEVEQPFQPITADANDFPFLNGRIPSPCSRLGLLSSLFDDRSGIG